MQNQIKQDYISENYPITVLEGTQYTVKQWLELQDYIINSSVWGKLKL